MSARDTSLSRQIQGVELLAKHAPELLRKAGLRPSEIELTQADVRGAIATLKALQPIREEVRQILIRRKEGVE